MKSKWKISIKKSTETINSRVFEVFVSDEGEEYSFKVEVDKDYSSKLLGEDTQNLLLVQQSFMFLLDREPVTSILRDFNIKEIQNYFPEYEKTMRNIFAS